MKALLARLGVAAVDTVPAGAWLALLGSGLVVVAIAALTTGPVAIASADMLCAFAAALGLSDCTAPPQAAAILIGLRLPRVILAMIVGGALSLCGAVMQGLFRNPLADPGLLGVSSGAALGAVATIVLGPGLLPKAWAPYALPLAAFLGALLATLAVQRIATVEGRTVTGSMLLAGIAVNALTLAVTGLFIFASDDRQLRDITFWTMGSLGGASWPKIAILLPFAAVTMAAAPLLARGLNALILGEREAGHLGLAVETLKRVAVVLVALAVGAAVSMSGIIGFVGLVVPHLMRLLLGADHRLLLPASGLAGASLLIAADLAARLVVAPAELPVGLVTSLVGGPFFIALLLREHSRMRGL